MVTVDSGRERMELHREFPSRSATPRRWWFMCLEKNTSSGKLLKVIIGYAFQFCINFHGADAKAEDPENVVPIQTGRSCFLMSSCCYGRNEEEFGDERVQPKTSCFSSKCCGGGGNKEGAVEENIPLQSQG